MTTPRAAIGRLGVSNRSFGGMMRKQLLLTLMLLAVLLVSGCQVAGPGASDPTETVLPADPSAGEYPAPGADPGIDDAYPGPDVIPTEMPDAGSALYPVYVDGDMVSWEQAVAMILNGEVTQVFQTHDLQVTISLKDGRSLTTTEPAIDDVMQVIETCGAPCQNIAIATE